MTYGEQAVGLSFNPSADPRVDEVKRVFAGVIDMMAARRLTAGSAEGQRIASIAITEAQTAQMWAVKALTWRE